MQTDNTRLWITEYALNCCSRNKAREAIRVPQPSMFSHPEIMPDFLTVEITNFPSYTDPFLCYFYPLDREKIRKSYSTMTIREILIWKVPILFRSLTTMKLALRRGIATLRKDGQFTAALKIRLVRRTVRQAHSIRDQCVSETRGRSRPSFVREHSDIFRTRVLYSGTLYSQ